MAVFPDRIVLKNSVDSQAEIEALIETNGVDPITQGEIVLGIEPTNVRFYTKAGDGSIVTLGSAAGAIAALGDLVDVDLSTTPPTDGQLIAYDSASGNWLPVDQMQPDGGLLAVVDDTTPELGGDLYTNQYYIRSSLGDVEIAPASSVLTVRGGPFGGGGLKLNCENNSHGVTIKSPPHSASATYTLTLPDNTGNPNQVLATDGTGSLSWTDNTGSGGGGGGAVNFDDLLDVDVALPSNGQIVSWFDDEAKWVKGPIATRWEYNSSEQYADDVSLLMNFNGNLDDAKGLTTSSTGVISYGAGPLNDQAALFNGSSIVEVNPDPSLDLPGDFTVEMWVYPNSATGTFQGLAARRSFPGPDSVGDWVAYINTVGIVEFADLGNNVYRQTSAGVVGAAWNHVAITRSSGVIRIFIGGVSRAAFTMGTDFTSTQALTVGQASTGSYLSGGVSDLRITKGVARYVVDFTPPATPLSLGAGPVATMPLDVLTDVSVPNPTPGQVLGWNSSSSRWEAVTPSTSGLPVASDGEALIWQNGAWAPGPMIGGVDYTGGDDDFNDVSLLLHCDGANGSTTFTDSSTNNFTIGVNQQAQIKTDQSKFGGGSAYFDGDTDYLQLPSDEKFSMGNGDFTVECFYRPTSKAAQYPRIIQFGSSPWQTNDNWALLDRHDDVNTKFSVAIYAVAGNTLILQSTTDVVDGTWYHLAVTRNGSTFRLFVDGVEEATYTSTTAVSASAAISGYIGGTVEGQSASSNGHVDEVRITKGVARYTSSFTPPTAAFPDTGGQVTIPYSIDNLDDVDISTTAPVNGQALVWNAANAQWEPGTVSGGGGGGFLNDLEDVTAVSPSDGDALVWAEHLNEWVVGTELVRWLDGASDPYVDQTVLLMNFNDDLVDQTAGHTPSISGTEFYDTPLYGTASLSFNGSSQLVFPTSADFSFSADFCLEFWVNPTSIPTGAGGAAFLCKRNLVGAESGTWGIILGETEFEFQDLQSITSYGSGAPLVAGTWQHIAVTREDSTLRMFIDGVLVATHSNVTRNFTNGQAMRFGRWDASGSYQYNGLLDDLRITNGAARYTATFTPPQSQLALTSNDKTATMPLDVLTDVSVANPAGGQVLGWNSSSSLWEPVSATGLPSGQDGAALIWEDGQWVAGPVIGGVDYTPSGTDPYYNSVSLLIRADGTDGSTSFTDDGPNALAITAQGNAQISTAQSKFGGSSAFFDGTGDSLSTPSDTSLLLDADFTIEAWVRPEASARGAILSSVTPSAFTSGVSLLLFDHPNAPDAVSLWVNDCGANFLVSSGALNTSTWYHIAIVRETGNITFYLNGTEVDTFACGSAVDFSDGGTLVGSYYGGGFNGYIDDLRITKGLARYTSDFSAPTEALPGGGAAVTIPYSINNLDDVDTSTVAATDSQALIWDDTASLWKPGSQNIQDLNDFELNEGSPWPYDFVWNTKTTPGPTAAGEWGTNFIFWDPTDAEGRNYSATGVTQFWLSSDNMTWIELTENIIYFAADGYYYVDSSTLQSTQIDNEGWTALYLSFTDPTGHSSDYTSLAEGDILQWNAVDQKFKPAQLPSGGGAVDSVNGETGAVSLGIQDMDDYEAKTYLTWTTYDSGTIDADEYGGSSGTYLKFSTSVDGQDVRDLLLASGAKYLQYGDKVVGPFFGQMLNVSGQSALYLNENSVITAEIRTEVQSHGLAGGSINLYASNFPKQDPDDGDILQWSNTDQKFKPAQLPSGGAVDSVNGETGVVSLGIQDMDDFTTEATIVVESVLVGSGYNDAENFRANASQWFISGSNSDGNPIPGFPRVGTSGTFKWTLDGAEYTVNYTDVATGVPNNWFIFSVADTEPGMDQLVSGNHGKTITFEFNSATSLLQDGTLVQWDARNQTFEPGQPALEDLSNVAKSVVYRFVGGEYSNPVRSAYAGQWGGNYNSSNRSTYLSYVDADNRDLSAVFRGLPATGQVQIWYSTDGTTFQSYNFSSFAPQPTGYQSGYGLFRGTVLPGSEGDDLFICFSDPSSLQPGDGSVLAWVDANSRWEPSSDYISLTVLKTEVAASTDFADFQAKIAAL